MEPPQICSRFLPPDEKKTTGEEGRKESWDVFDTMLLPEVIVKITIFTDEITKIRHFFRQQ